jgi:lipopolysaccharide transport system permease protein
MITGEHVLASLRQLLRYRALVSSLVARELKARYRGSVLGFLWTFVNPLLLLLVYSFVFGVVMPGARAPDIANYPLFLFCGILPWTWFSSSLLESCTSLTASGGLLRKVMFPAEILPVVTVFTGLVNFLFGLVIFAAFSIYAGVPILTPDLVWLPLIVLVQLVLTLGLALLLSALAVHFRDIRDLLGSLMTLWFFATPVIYPYTQAPERFRPVLDLNPFTHLAVAYQDVLYLEGPYRPGGRLAVTAAVGLVALVVGYAVFDRLRETFAEEV